MDELHPDQLPQNIEAEQALLGALLVNNKAFEKVSEFLHTEHFADPIHAKIFDIISKLITRGHVADTITLKNYFEQDGSLDEVGGYKYLIKLADSATPLTNAEYYAQFIYDKYLRRELIATGFEIVNNASKEDIDTDATEQIENAEKRLFDLANQGESSTGFIDFGQALTDSVKRIESAYQKEGRISGTFTLEEARQLTIVLKAGALPAPVRIIEKRTIGPTLGEDSIKSGLGASLYALLAILLFMIIYYKWAGFIADTALVLNLVLLMAVMSYFSATLTVPGIAGIILSLAMAIDANVLIIERMREEKLLGKPIPTIIQLGYDKAWSAIFDSNITTIIVGCCLLQFGTGPVKGFAVTLIIGLTVSLFTAVFVTRAMYELILTSNPKEISL